MSNNENNSGGYILVGLGGCVLGANWLLWLAGQLSSVLSGRGWPDSSPTDAFGLIPALLRGELASAWPVEAAVLLGSARTIYVIFGLLMAGAAVVGFLVIWVGLGWRRRRGFRWGRLGFASGLEIRRLIGYRALLRRVPLTRPALAGRNDVDPLQVGYFLGRDVRSRRRLYSSVEDPVLIVGPTSKGKDAHFVTPITIDAPGAVVVVSTELESFTTTYQARRDHGSVYVFDPDNMTGWPTRTRLCLVRGCETPSLADDRATMMAMYAGFHMGAERTPGHDASHFSATAAIVILRCYLHAAALHGRNMTDVVRWAWDPSSPEPIALLRQAEAAGVGTPGWAAELEGLTLTDQEARTAMWATVSQSLRFLHNPGVLDQFSPGPDEVFNVAEFVSGRNTLYILGKERGDNPITPGVHMLLETIWGQTRAAAARMPGGRIEPPVTVEINEAASIAPMGSLPRWMSITARSSIALHVYVRSLSHMKDRFGEKSTRNMWDSATFRVILGGGGNVEDLAEVSRLVGEVRRPPGLADPGHNDVISPILTIEDLRTMKFGRAVVVARDARPVEIKLTPWWKRRDGAEIAASKREMTTLLDTLAATAPVDTRVKTYIQSQAHPTATPRATTQTATLNLLRPP